MTTSSIDSAGGADRAAVDFAVLGDWMREQGLPGGQFHQIESIGGGTQNVMLRFMRGNTAYVLRRPPLHRRPRSNDVLRREVRLLGALNDTPVRSPRLIAACTDDSVFGGAVLYT